MKQSETTNETSPGDTWHIAYLILGSNIGNRTGWLAGARSEIAARIGAIEKFSELYETAPWGKTDQAAFVNQALKVRTQKSPEEILHIVHHIEEVAGRQRREHWGPRTLDIDILLYDDLSLHTRTLTIPHPQMQERRFVLVPLAEIAAEYHHPLLGVSISDLLTTCPDQSEVAILATG